MKAIIPAAGKGTRMFSVTQGAPKELLRLGRASVIERVIREAYAADVDEVIVVNSADKTDLSEHVLGLTSEVPVRVAIQDPPRGLGDAVASAGIEGDAVVLCADTPFHGGSPIERMANLIYRGIDAAIAVETVSDEDVSQYGIAEVNEGNGAILRTIEKPQPQETTSRYAVAGRYAFSGNFMAFLNEYAHEARPGLQGELALTPIIQAAIEAGLDVRAVPVLEGQERVDCGSVEGYRYARGLLWD